MKRKTVFVIVLCLVLVAITIAISLLTQVSTTRDSGLKHEKTDDSSKKVVCSFYPVYIAALNITKGVDGVEILSLSQPQTGCLHDYQMTSEDVKLIESAGLLICNGGGMEHFVSAPEYAKKYPNLSVVYASENLPVNELQEDNAHFWMDPDLYEIYAQKVAIALSDFDTENAESYMENYASYVHKIEEVAKLKEEIDLSGKKVVLLSESLSYLVKDLDMDTCMFIDMEEDTVSAEDVAKACEMIKTQNAIVIYDDEGEELANTLKLETDGVAICLDDITSGEYDEDAWLSGMAQNYKHLKDVK